MGKKRRRTKEIAKAIGLGGLNCKGKYKSLMYHKRR